MPWRRAISMAVQLFGCPRRPMAWVHRSYDHLHDSRQNLWDSNSSERTQHCYVLESIAVHCRWTIRDDQPDWFGFFGWPLNTDGQVCAGIRQSTVDDVVRTKVMWNQPRQRRSYYCVTDVFRSTIVCPFSITGKHFGLFHQHGALRPLTLILCLLTLRCLVSFR